MAKWQEWLQRLQNGKGLKAACILGAVGVLCIGLSSWLPQDKEKENTVAARTAEQYCEQMENRLSSLLNDMEGVGDCQVYVTLENGVEYVYATEQKNNSDREEDVNCEDTRLTQRDDSESTAILIDTDNGREGLLVTEIQPTVRGVVVVCEGGDNEEVRARVLQAVTVALNISSKRVCITKLS